MKIAALILSIASIVFCYSPFFGLACAIVGLILANKAKAALTEAGEDIGMAKTASILAIIGLILSIIGTIGCLACSICAAATADTSAYYYY